MPGIHIDVDVKDYLPVAGDAIRSKAGKAIAKAARDIEAQAKANAPVDTGNLRNSINSEQERAFNWKVHSPAEYSVYVEYGTSKAPAKPFLTPAVEMVKPALFAALKDLA